MPVPMLRAAGAALFACLLTLPAAGAGTGRPTGTLFVKWSEAADLTDLNAPSDERRQRLNASLQQARLPFQAASRSTPGWYRVSLPADATAAEIEALTRRVRALPGVQDVVRETREKPLAVRPNDALFGQQWWLQTRDGSRTGVAAFTAAWSLRAAGAGPVVAVLDSGITYHPDLFAQVLPGHDMVADADYAGDGDGRDADPNDEGDAVTDDDRQRLPAKFGGCPAQPQSGWHGTAIAGQLGASTDNGAGVASAGFGLRVLPVRVAGKCGAAQGDIVDGMRWAAGLAVEGVPANPNPARIVVLSYGSDAACDALYRDTLAELRQAGVLVVAAAGNERTSVFRPASCTGAFAVTSLNREGYKATYANYGAEVKLATPGGDDATGGSCDAYLADGGLVTTGNLGEVAQGAAGYVAASGTSFAAPSVAATAALMLGVNPTLTLRQIEDGLRLSAAPFVQVPLLGRCAADDNPGRCTCDSGSCGAGMLDAEQALVYAKAPAAYAAPVRGTVTLRDERIESCALALGRPVDPEDDDPPEEPPREGPANGGGGASGPVWLLLLALAAAALRRRG